MGIPLETRFNGQLVIPNPAYEGEVSAEVYDLLHPDKNYPREAKFITKIVKEHGLPDSTSLLDVACGTVLQLALLADNFPDAAGLDKSAAQLARAEERVQQNVTLHQGDMANFDLGRQFDVVTCLFGSVAYLSSHEALNDGIQTMASHTKPGGLIIIEPWVSPKEFSDIREQTRLLTVEGEQGKKITRVSTVGSGPPPNEEGSVDIRMNFMYGRRVGERMVTDIFVEDHLLGVFSPKTYKRALRNAGVTHLWQKKPSRKRPVMGGVIVGRMQD